jgi:hypothetical protein
MQAFAKSRHGKVRTFSRDKNATPSQCLSRTVATIAIRALGLTDNDSPEP